MPGDLPSFSTRLPSEELGVPPRKTRISREKQKQSNLPFFPRDAVIRRVHSEAVVLLGGGRALLMQVAHPKVAAGVAEHSSFREGKRKRLLRTLKPTLAIVFGTDAQARAAAAGVNAVHAHVAGEGYRAGDPDLLFWVLATLIDTALLMHERFRRPLSPADAEAYYQDMLRAGELLGVRRDQAPADMQAFRAYMGCMSRDLRVTDEARSIARDLFAGHGPAALGGWAIRHLTAQLLAPQLRDAYGLQPPRGLMGRAEAGLLAALAAVLPRTPMALRRTPTFLLPQDGGPEPL